MASAIPGKGILPRLIEKGVSIPHPESVYVGGEVNPDRIAPGTLLFPGTRLQGESLSIGKNCRIGEETPATVIDCQLGAAVELKGGYFERSVFQDGANAGSGSHIRAGCLLEEESGVAHTVGLKQTILFPFVVTGSLVNFCDCLMAGGTSRKNHSEVGSSYIHFNYTPHQDKATPSLLGDVPRGVFLDQPPIFLGGQGGLVGPVHLSFGTVVPAGCVLRRDVETDGQLVIPPALGARGTARPYHPSAYGAVDRVVRNNLVYIGNLMALLGWYRVVRTLFVSGDPFAGACCRGATAVLELVLKERIRRLDELAGKMPASIAVLRTEEDGGDLIRQQEVLASSWPSMERRLTELAGRAGQGEAAERVAAAVESARTMKYVETVQSLSGTVKAEARAWLQGMVDSCGALWHPDA